MRTSSGFGIAIGKEACSGYFSGSMRNTLLASSRSVTSLARAAMESPVISMICGVS